jgi:hypothetical protein
LQEALFSQVPGLVKPWEGAQVTFDVQANKTDATATTGWCSRSWPGIKRTKPESVALVGDNELLLIQEQLTLILIGLCRYSVRFLMESGLDEVLGEVIIRAGKTLTDEQHCVANMLAGTDLARVFNKDTSPGFEVFEGAQVPAQAVAQTAMQQGQHSL